jgi:hypothetical protein
VCLSVRWEHSKNPLCTKVLTKIKTYSVNSVKFFPNSNATSEHAFCNHRLQ